MDSILLSYKDIESKCGIINTKELDPNLFNL